MKKILARVVFYYQSLSCSIAFATDNKDEREPATFATTLYELVRTILLRMRSRPL